MYDGPPDTRSIEEIFAEFEEEFEDENFEQYQNASSLPDSEVTDLLDTLHKRPELKMLFSTSKNATKEDIEKAIRIIDALKDNK